jgi:hypothetical protein
MHRADSLLKPFIKDLGIEDRIRFFEIKRNWDTLFQEPLASHMFPILLSRGELLLAVDSPVWLQELNFYRDDIIKKLVPFGIGAVRFKLGRITKNVKSEIKSQKSRAKRLTNTEQTFIRKTVDEIRDEGLKETLKITMEKAIVSGKTKIS